MIRHCQNDDIVGGQWRAVWRGLKQQVIGLTPTVPN